MLAVEREWHRISRDMPVVTICPFIAGETDAAAEMHTAVVSSTDL